MLLCRLQESYFDLTIYLKEDDMLRYCLAVMVALLTLQGEAEAGGTQRHNILCFTQSGLEQVLNRIVNQQQFLRNSPWHDITKGEFNRAGCVIGSIPSGSTAALVDLHETGHGFIFFHHGVAV